MKTAEMNETLNTLLLDNRLPEPGDALSFLGDENSRYLKDLRINLSNAFKTQSLSRRESVLIAIAVARNEQKKQWLQGLEEMYREEGGTNADLAEVAALVSLLNVNNVFYRFKHFMQKDVYNNAPAGIKMNLMLQPVIGKGLFELLSLVVSALNGCQLCVESHEDSVRKHGYNEAQIFDAIRSAAIFKGLCNILD